jgi:hypothetical protein
VQREGDDIVLHFGSLTGSELAPGALGAQLQHRVVMSVSGAAKLQDLLVELLRDQQRAGNSP